MNGLAIELVAVTGLVLVALWLSACLIKQQKLLRQEKINQKEWIDRGNRALSEITPERKINSHNLAELIEKFTSFQAYFTELETTYVTEDQLQNAPFWIDPYLASMALRTGKTVQQHQLSQWKWAIAYIPFIHDGKVQGIMALGTKKQSSIVCQSFDLLLAEFICTSFIAKRDSFQRSA